MVATKAKPERMDMRLSREHKRLIERAAAALGVPATTLAIEAIVTHAHAVLARHEQTRVSARDMKRFCELLDQAPVPNAALKRAAKRAKAQLA